MNAFEYIKYVTTPLGLLAFLAVILYYYHWLKNKRDISLIKTIPESERAALVTTLSDKFNIDTSRIHPKDLYKVVLATLEHKTKRLKIRGIIFLLAAIILSLLIVGWQVMEIKYSNTTIKVDVPGIVGKRKVNLSSGILTLEVISLETKRSSINENGEAFFKNVPIGKKARLSLTCTEPYKALYSDSIFQISNNETIYFPVILQGVDRISGIILHGDLPLPGVLVQWDTLAVVTDKAGRFEMRVPLEQQSDQYTVRFNKDGFKFKERTARPSAGNMEIQMEKRYK